MGTNTNAKDPSRVVSILAVLVLVTLAVVLVGKRTNHDPDEPAAASAPASSTPAVVPSPSLSTAAPASSPASVAASSTTPTVTTSPTPAQKLTGDQLAHAWLRAYLTRPAGAADESWTTAIAPLSDPALVETLAKADNPVGLDWPTWRVTAIKPAPGGEKHANTVSRHMSRWLVTIQGPGNKTAVRLYDLTAYMGDNGWSVAQAEQGYFSNG